MLGAEDYVLKSGGKNLAAVAAGTIDLPVRALIEALANATQPFRT
jgi:hypothetical protein